MTETSVAMNVQLHLHTRNVAAGNFDVGYFCGVNE